MTLFKKRDDSEIVDSKSLSLGMFSGDQDKFDEALCFWYTQGWHDTYAEAQNS